MIYHGWADTIIPAEPIVDYYNEVIDTTYGGDRATADDAVRLFMIPGMAHCGGGPGPSRWDRLEHMVDWVENGAAPDSMTVQRVQRGTDGVVDNERIVCPASSTGRSTPARATRTTRRTGSRKISCANELRIPILVYPRRMAHPRVSATEATPPINLIRERTRADSARMRPRAAHEAGSLPPELPTWAANG